MHVLEQVGHNGPNGCLRVGDPGHGYGAERPKPAQHRPVRSARCGPPGTGPASSAGPSAVGRGRRAGDRTRGAAVARGAGRSSPRRRPLGHRRGPPRRAHGRPGPGSRRRAKRCCDCPPAADRPCTCRLPTLDESRARPSNTPAAYPPSRTSSTPTRRSTTQWSTSAPVSGGNGTSHLAVAPSAAVSTTASGPVTVVTGPCRCAKPSSQRAMRSGGTVTTRGSLSGVAVVVPRRRDRRTRSR
jgi:hypothetical protein